MSDRSHVLFFGPFELDTRAGELRRDGSVVKLAPQPFKALTLLVQRGGDLVTRDELRNLLWGDDHFVDFTAGLNFCIAQLRQALDDPASNPRFVVAVPRRGYKFIAPVSTGVAETAAANAPTARTSARRAPALIAVAAIAFVVVGGLVVARVAPRRESRAIDIEVMQRFERAASDLADASPRELQDRVRLFEQAIARDDRFARAYAGLADAKLIIGNYLGEHPSDAYAFAKAAASRALALDPELGEAHAMFAASVMYLDWDWRLAATHFDLALALAPDSLRVHQWFSRFLSARGDHARAIEHARRAVRLAAGSPSAHTSLGVAEYYGGRFADAVAHCQEAIELMSAFEPARFCITAATLESRSAKTSAGTSSDVSWRERLDSLLRLPEEECVLRAVSLAAAFAHVGNHDEAFKWLDIAANRRVDTVLFAAVHPGLQPLHDDVRFTRLRQRIGLSETQAQ